MKFPPFPTPGTAARVLLLCVSIGLSLFVARTYWRVYDSDYGASKLILFGSNFEPGSLPRLKRVRHFVAPDPASPFGYDGQFYAQLAIDPSLADPAFDTALDNPSYRARRIGLPALSFCLGLGKPRWIIQAYALSNLLFWFVLLGALLALFRPWIWRHSLCLAAAMLGTGVVASMEEALTDLPAAAMIFTGLAIVSWGGRAAMSWAVLTRETSLLAVIGLFDFLRPPRPGGLARKLGLSTLMAAPFALWLLYSGQRFDGLRRAAGDQNFALPFWSIVTRFTDGIRQWAENGPAYSPWKTARLDWLYRDFLAHELLTILAICFQGVYLILRRELHSPFWRIGICYLVLCCVLGPGVWENTSAAARVLLPMTICFYLLLARERTGWFWTFLIGGGLSIPYGVHNFWYLT